MNNNHKRCLSHIKPGSIIDIAVHRSDCGNYFCFTDPYAYITQRILIETKPFKVLCSKYIYHNIIDFESKELYIGSSFLDSISGDSFIYKCTDLERLVITKIY